MLIYRGVNTILDAYCSGLIKPKGLRAELEVECGDANANFGVDSLELGSSPSTAQYLHNICSDTYQTSYVSFTTSEEEARRFATSGKMESGWVYVTDTEMLEAVGISAGAEPGERLNSDEAEVLVNLTDHEFLPAKLIIKKYGVDEGGVPINDQSC
ncbi:hypothetical protein ACIOZM_08080 [Pseudomonas sp. NPDC087346]|uniref:hypothetical protein n=1 Tax=Pseudomonas sp. NPDC087346 TaxID=3364438 RepID=UPI003813EDB6